MPCILVRKSLYNYIHLKILYDYKNDMRPATRKERKTMLLLYQQFQLK